MPDASKKQPATKPTVEEIYEQYIKDDALRKRCRNAFRHRQTN